MTLNLTQIATALTQIGVVAGVVAAAWKIVDKHVIKRVSALERKAGDFAKETAGLRADIKDGAERDRLILDGVLACLKCLRKQGRADVSSKITEIEGYVTKQACRTAG